MLNHLRAPAWIRRGLLIAGCVALTGSCGSALDADGMDEGALDVVAVEAEAEPLVSVDADLDPNAAATSWRYVLLKPSTAPTCPVPVAMRGEWSVRPLFAQPGEDWASIPPGLKDYCLYNDNFASHSLGATTIPPELARLGRVVADKAAVVPAGDPLGELVAPVFAQAADEQTGRMPSMPPPSGGALPTRLVLIDTIPTAAPGIPLESIESTSRHGYNLARLLKRLVCDDAGYCSVELRSELGFQLRYGEAGKILEDEKRGGEFGTIGFLAEAIRRAVHSWELLPEDARPRLVINLSVGWLPIYSGPDVAAVQAALRDARCRGALVIAAAGNRTYGPSHDTGALLPGGLEKLAEPTTTQCGSYLGVAGGDELHTAQFEGLVFAAGGIDETGADLGASRSGGRPKIVAYGEHAVARDAVGKAEVMTGTSIASAVVAASASVAWTYRPKATGDLVLQMVYDSGEEVTDPAGAVVMSDTAFTIFPWPVHRASVCRAAAYACARGGEACPSPSAFPSCAPWDKTPLALGTKVNFSAFDASAMRFSEPPLELHFHDGVCDAEAEDGDQVELYNVVSKEMSPNPCPDVQHYSAAAAPWTGPQPGLDPCPNCAYFKTATLARLAVQGSSFSVMTGPVLAFRSGLMLTKAIALADLPIGSTVDVSVGASSSTTSVMLSGKCGTESCVSTLDVVP